MANDKTPDTGTEGDGSTQPRRRRPKRAANPAVQSQVLRASMADAIAGSHINAGPDSTAALLLQVAQGAKPDSEKEGLSDQSSALTTLDVPTETSALLPPARNEAPVQPGEAGEGQPLTSVRAQNTEPIPSGTGPERPHAVDSAQRTPQLEPAIVSEPGEATPAKVAAAPSEPSTPEPVVHDAIQPEHDASGESAGQIATAPASDTVPTLVQAPQPGNATDGGAADSAAPDAASSQPLASGEQGPDATSEPADSQSASEITDADESPAANPAQDALQASFVDNRLNSNTWASWGFRLVPDVKERLAKRMEADKRSSRNRRLAQGHYVNAAMLTICPKSVKGQLALIREWLTERDAYTEQGRPSNYLVSKPVWDVASTLDMELTSASKRGQVIYLFSAVLERYLDQLDEEGSFPPPRRRVK